ncbi:MAG: 16S rRNA processing protein RimM [Deltaproteobacteria bacterium]|nr:16S rRNA processing protein RimM [Deltaproteobacteria bacterium]
MVPDSRYVLIGQIVGVHGMGGNLKLRSYAESEDIFAPGRLLLAARGDGTEKIYEVNWVQAHGRTMLLSLKGVADRRQAEDLVGWDLFIEKAMLPELDPGTYYWDDLIGMDVYDGNGVRLGRLESIFRTGSNDVYVVADAGRELLVPAIASVVTAVDLTARRIDVNLPEGLEWQG